MNREEEDAEYEREDDEDEKEEINIPYERDYWGNWMY